MATPLQQNPLGACVNNVGVRVPAVRPRNLHFKQILPPRGQCPLNSETAGVMLHDIAFFKFFYFFFGCIGSSLLRMGLSSCGEWGPLFPAVRRLLIAVASLVWSTGSRCAGFSSCGSQALEHRLSSRGA